MAFITIYVTHKSLKEAKKISSHLLRRRLIACANFFPIESAYWWNGKVTRSKEMVSLLKTQAKNWLKVKSEIRKIHPYVTPCIMKFNVQANAEYEKWVKTETK